MIQKLTDEEYKFIFERVPRLCLDFVVVQNGGVVLSKRAIEPCKGMWHLPGGMVYHKETIEDASKRIIGGELGVEIPEKKLIGFMEFPDEINKDGLHVHSVSMVFLVKLKGDKIAKDDNSTEVKIFKATPDNVHPVHKKFLEENKKSIYK
ncbi:MAG: NUDIX domain-containing protein [Candidatus Staskawiczbacteria bacterium]|nr:NUDIX domain-containing protein [Candidatus Staskawiczbacteria bacterium]